MKISLPEEEIYENHKCRGLDNQKISQSKYHDPVTDIVMYGQSELWRISNPKITKLILLPGSIGLLWR